MYACTIDIRNIINAVKEFELNVSMCMYVCMCVCDWRAWLWRCGAIDIRNIVNAEFVCMCNCGYL